MMVDRSENTSAQRVGLLMVNADDWGRDRETTDRTFDCIRRGRVTSVSAMVFMADSDRAAEISRGHWVDTGLHINFTSPFSGSVLSSKLRDYQNKVSKHLMRHRFSQSIFHPRLTAEFEYVVRAQIDEFERLYGHVPARLDGHHHMHLCANVLLQGLLPLNTMVRRNFSFEPGEKSIWNRGYRKCIDAILARRYRITDYFFSIVPLKPESRLRNIRSLSRTHVVEVEVHPVKKDEYEFLMDGGFARLT